jgi:AcrR family transcriptional regulator
LPHSKTNEDSRQRAAAICQAQLAKGFEANYAIHSTESGAEWAVSERATLPSVARLESTLPQPTDRDKPSRPRKGERTRQAILDRAAARASERGLGSLSLGALAEELSMSKSGLFSHFGSREELQLATVERAREIFVAEVIEPALRVPQGVERLRALCDAWLSYVERGVFPGGCFFSTTTPEFANRPGIVHDRLVALMEQWLRLLEGACQAARRKQELRQTLDPRRFAFELFAIGDTASRYYGVLGPKGIKDALQTIHELIDEAASASGHTRRMSV